MLISSASSRKAVWKGSSFSSQCQEENCHISGSILASELRFNITYFFSLLFFNVVIAVEDIRKPNFLPLIISETVA